MNQSGYLRSVFFNNIFYVTCTWLARNWLLFVFSGFDPFFIFLQEFKLVVETLDIFNVIFYWFFKLSVLSFKAV